MEIRRFNNDMPVCVECDSYIRRSALIGGLLKLSIHLSIVLLSLAIGLGLFLSGEQPEDALLLSAASWAGLWVLLLVGESALPITETMMRAGRLVTLTRRPEGFIANLGVSDHIFTLGALPPGSISASGIAFFHPDFVTACRELNNTSDIQHHPLAPSTRWPVRLGHRIKARIGKKAMVLGAGLGGMLCLVFLGGTLVAGVGYWDYTSAIKEQASELTAMTHLYEAMLEGAQPTAAVSEQHCADSRECLKLQCYSGESPDYYRRTWTQVELEGTRYRCPSLERVYNQLEDQRSLMEPYREERDKYWTMLMGSTACSGLSFIFAGVLLVGAIRQSIKPS